MPHNQDKEGWENRFDEQFKPFIAYRTGGRVTDFTASGGIEVVEQLEHCEKEIKDFIRSLLASHQEDMIREIEKRYGKKGEMRGSFGYQGILMGVQAFQTPEDKTRDDIIDIIAGSKNIKI